MKSKRCSKCRELKPLSSFHKLKRSADGHRSQCRECRSAYQRAHFKKWIKEGNHAQQHRDRVNNHHRKIRLKVLNFLGSECVKCCFSNVHALQIDHIYGGGTSKEPNRQTMYRKILLMSIDEARKTYQILCANCNQIKKYENKEYTKRRIY